MNFSKTFLAALLAFVVGGILVTIFTVMIFAGFVSAFGEKPYEVRPNSVLVIDFSNGITDSPNSSPLGSVGIGGIEILKSNSMLETLRAIENAAYDANIKGIYINLTGGEISIANVEELRAAVQAFKDISGKFVISYADYYSQLGYYFSSVADKVFVHPEGMVEWQGLSSQVMFYKGLLDKLGIKVEILRHGSFKSGVEPFMLKKMSAENRLQMGAMVGSVWNMVLDDVSASRGISKEDLSSYATDLNVGDAASAVRLGLVDAVLYNDQVMDIIGALATSASATVDLELARVTESESMSTVSGAAEISAQTSGSGIPEDEADVTRVVSDDDVNVAAKPAGYGKRGPEYVELGSYISSVNARVLTKSRNRVAVIYIDGDIVDGQGEKGSVGSIPVSEKFARARADESIKAVVLRVNSPGGSALASDVMWREAELLRREKPLIVSMGGYAASGGYYVSCPGDVIVADRSTLTGSIGVFGLMFNLENTLADNIGITVDAVTTNPHADMGSPFRAMGPREREFMMRQIERTYRTFVGHVARGRNMTAEAVDEIGGGRVWTGADALGIGLVDGIGGLSDAIAIAADRAGITGDYRIIEVVDTPDALSMLIKSLSGSQAASVEDRLGMAFERYNNIRKMLDGSGIQARMPYSVEIR